MKKTWIILFIVFGILGTFLSACTPVKKDYLLSKSEIENKDFLKNKSALVYFSTTADQDVEDGGVGFVTFIDKKGSTSTLKTKGLELGGVAANNQQILIEDKEKLIYIGKKYKEIPLNKTQHTGERVGIMKKKGIFYTIFNSGFNENGGYNSDIYWGNEDNMSNDSIPNYIITSGQTDEFIYIITSSAEEPEKLILSKVNINHKVIIEKVTEWNMPTDNFILSNILIDENYYYYIEQKLDEAVNNYANTYVVRIEKDTLKREEHIIESIKEPQDSTARIPFDTGKSLFEYNNDLLFVNGLGNIYKFDKNKQEVINIFNLDFIKKSPNVSYGEQVAVKNNLVYFYKFDPQDNKYFLEKYNLKNGKLESSQQLTGMKEVMKTLGNRYAPSYELVILEE